MSGKIVLGIDLGTTNSVVAVADGEHAQVLSDIDGQKLIPSVVSFLADGQVIAGELARERRLIDAKNTVYAIKRLIGRPFDAPEVKIAQERFAFDLVRADDGGLRVEIRGESWALAEISAYVLRECRRLAERVLEQDCDQAVITVPANFNELQRSATKAAGKVAGLDVLRILNEPTAAAVAYGYGAERAETVAVYDLGGGTFDITILDLEGDVFEVVATAGDTFLGGDDIDLLIAEDMADAAFKAHGLDPRRDPQTFERLRAAAEWAKCELSSKPLVKVRLGDLGVDTKGEGVDFEYHSTRLKLEEKTRPLIARSLEVCKDALATASMTSMDIDRVVLVGGSTRIPLVQQMVGELFGQPGCADMDPDLVVALGASVQAYALAEKVPRRTLSMVRQPSPAAVQEVERRKLQARLERPQQPAFASPSIVTMAPTVAVSGSGPSPSPPRSRAYVPPAPGDMRHAGAPSPTPEPPRAGASDVAVTDAPGLTEEVVDRVPEPPSARPGLAGLPPVLLGLTGDEDVPESDQRPAQGYEFGDLDLTPGSTAEAPGDPGSSPPPVGGPPPTPAARQGMVMDAERGVPLLMDVTPHSLGIRTAGGWCEQVIRRNAPIPVEQLRLFTAAQDGQETVHVAVCQGESRAFEENQPLGEIALVGLRGGRRGEMHIEVTFMLDADGTLDVSASDVATGQHQAIRVKLVGGFSEDEVLAMQQRQEGRMA